MDQKLLKMDFMRNCVLLTVAVLAASALLRAAVLQKMTTDQMVAAATDVVRGTVSGQYSSSSGGFIFTHYKIAISERWKGATKQTLDVAVPGGSSGGLRETFAGAPTLKAGHEYLLFLWQGSNGPEQIIGLSQGVLEVAPDEQGTAMVSRPASGEIMLDAPTGRIVRDQAVSIKLTDVRAHLVAVMSGDARR